MIMGFGDIEVKTAKRIINECIESIGSDIEKADEKMKVIESKYDEAEKLYSAMGRSQAPERYSHFWFIINHIYKGKCIIEFDFHHIGRRHVLSPDGWALLKTYWILTMCNSEGNKIFREA